LRVIQPAIAVRRPAMIIRTGMLDLFTAVVWLTMMFPYRGWGGVSQS
jgi:hypothetical protein